MIPLRTAYRISSGTLCRFSFCRICVRWVSTVYRLRLSIPAISLLALAFGHQLQDFALAVGEQLVAVLGAELVELVHVILFQQTPDRGAEEGFAFGDGSNGGNQIGLRGILQQIGAGAGLERPDHVALIACAC